MCLNRSALLSRIFFILSTIFVCHICATLEEDKCKECRFLVATFKEGLNRTSKSHFGGGNTEWEERKLGKFLTSEIRFAEVMEFVCKKESLIDASEFHTKELQFKCHALAEEAEEVLENWFFELQDGQPDLGAYLCVEQLKRCCPAGHFGANCAACPGLVPAASSNEDGSNKVGEKPAMRGCFGRGRCKGDGTRGGSGKCDCDVGYVGKMCSNCGPHFFPSTKTATSLECEECFDGCAGGCSAAGPKGCKGCLSGYAMDEAEGCKDVDECAAPTSSDSDGVPIEPKCTKAHEKCVNTQGSYHCACEDGYTRDEDGEECVLDVEARPLEGAFPPDVLLRAFAIFALAGTCIFVWLFHRTLTTVTLTFLAIGAAIFVEYHYDWIIPKAARKFIDHTFPRGF